MCSAARLRCLSILQLKNFPGRGPPCAGGVACDDRFRHARLASIRLRAGRADSTVDFQQSPSWNASSLVCT